MTTEGSQPVFLDTNILVAALDRARPGHDAAVQLLNFDERQVAIGDQSVREFLAAATRPISANGLGMSTVAAVAAFEHLADGVEIRYASSGSTRRLVELIRLGGAAGKQVHDANLVAVALEHGAAAIVTDNQRHFARFADLIRIEPLGPL